ncbi:MAG: thiamine pyrophosphate-binding protein [Actinomycetota bacterium]
MSSSPPLPERLAAALADVGVTTLFGLPGGGPNLDLIGAAEARGIRFVLAHGETAAAIMASSNGLTAGRPAAVVVTRGPGAASLANGVAQATLDRHPLIALTDTVPAAARSRVAHQRLDQSALLAPVSKRSLTVGSGVDDEELRRCLADASRWPSGAVHLDVDATADGLSATSPTPDDQTMAANEQLDRARALLDRAERPIVIVGAEAAAMATETDAAVGTLAPLLERFGAPVLTTYQGIGVVPTEGAIHAGLFTNGALEQPVLDAADLVITLGLDLVEPIPASWTSDAPVLPLSSVPQRDDYLPASVDVVAPWPDLVAVLTGEHRWGWATDAASRFRTEARAALDRPADGPGLGPNELVEGLVANRPADVTVTVDAGAHFLAVMPRWPVDRPNRLLISNGLATMGYAVPAAIGAALARPGEPVLALTGDGGLSMVLAELETIARLDLPITVVVFNDSALSLIEIKQGEANGGAGAVRYRPTDFAAMARASGLDGITIDSLAALEAACQRTDWDRPRLLDVRVDPTPYRHLIAVTRG